MNEDQKEYIDQLFMDYLDNCKNGKEAYFEIISFIEMFGGSPATLMGNGGGKIQRLELVEVERTKNDNT